MERPRMSLPLSLYISYQFLDYSQMALRSRLGRESIFSLSLSLSLSPQISMDVHILTITPLLLCCTYFSFPTKPPFPCSKLKIIFSLSLSLPVDFFFFFFFEVRVSDFNFSLFGSFNLVYLFFAHTKLWVW